MLLNESRVGLPMGFQMSIIAIGAMILQIALNRLGSTAIAGFIAAQKIDQLANQPMMSFGITMATYAAQNYGAGNMRRIRAGVRRCILMSVGFSIVCGGALILAAKPMAGLFVGAVLLFPGPLELCRLRGISVLLFVLLAVGGCAVYFLLTFAADGISALWSRRRLRGHRQI